MAGGHVYPHVQPDTDPLDRISAVCHEGNHERCGGQVWWHYLPRNPSDPMGTIACECECHRPGNVA